jgi:phosphoglycerate dehydrogenase-like enzyme
MHGHGAWKEKSLVNLSLFGRRVGLHGFGAIGQALLPLLRPFEVEVSAYSPSVPDEIFAENGVQRAATLEDLFAGSDVLIELAPYTPKNRHIVGRELLSLLPEGAVFVNVGRGAVTDEKAVAEMARSGRLQVALDVYENEPLPKDSPFRGLPNVTLLPHIAGPTRDRRCDAGSFAMQNLKNYLLGKPLTSVVSLDVYDRAS